MVAGCIGFQLRIIETSLFLCQMTKLIRQHCILNNKQSSSLLTHIFQHQLYSNKDNNFQFKETHELILCKNSIRRRRKKRTLIEKWLIKDTELHFANCLHISPVVSSSQPKLLLSLRIRDSKFNFKMFPLIKSLLGFYLVFFSKLPVLALNNSTQRFEIHKMLTEIADITTTIQETQTHLGIKPSAAPPI